MANTHEAFIEKEMRKAKKMRDVLTKDNWRFAKSPQAVRLLGILAIAPLPLTILWYVTEGRSRWMSWWYFSPAAFPAGTFLILIAFTAALILGRSVRRITSLPVSYLDEREKQVRGHAYHSTYKTLAKFAAAMLTVAAIYGLLGDFGVLRTFDAWVFNSFSNQVASGADISQLGGWLQGFVNPFGSGFGNAVVFGGAFFFLLWVLPILKIAKLEAQTTR